MDQWYVKSGEAIEGPLSESAVIAGLVQRMFSRQSIVNRVGSAEWVAVDAHPPFQEAIATRSGGRSAKAAQAEPVVQTEVFVPRPGFMADLPQPQPQAPPPPPPVMRRRADWGGRLAVASGVASLFSAVALVTTVGVEWRAWEAAHSETEAMRKREEALAARVEAVRAEVAARSAAQPVDFAAMTRACFGFNSHATCTFTNAAAEPVRTCWGARLSLKSAPGVQLESLPACTGRIEPFSTHAATVPWTRGNADDICKSKGAFNIERLDWSVCNVDFFAVNPK